MQPELIDDLFNDIDLPAADDSADVGVPAADADEWQTCANDELHDTLASTVLNFGKGVSPPDAEPRLEGPGDSHADGPEEVQDPALSSAARDATGEASTSGRPPSKTGSTSPEVVQDAASSSSARDATDEASTSGRTPPQNRQHRSIQGTCHSHQRF